MTCADLCPLSTWRGDNLVCVIYPVNRKFSQGLASAARLASSNVNILLFAPWCGSSAFVRNLCFRV